MRRDTPYPNAKKKKGKVLRYIRIICYGHRHMKKKIQQKAPRICQYLRRVKTISKSQDRGTEH